MSWHEWLAVPLLLSGAVFFLTGTIGLVRFPDTWSRLHAVTKADNVGLGLMVAGLASLSASAAVTFKLVLVWVLAMLAATFSCHLISRYSLRESERDDR